MEARSSKRRRLIQSYISPQRPDLPATFESLNDDTLTTTLEFVGNKSYATYAGINKHCREIYLATPGMTKETFLYGYAPLAVIKGRIIEERESRDINSHPHEVVGNEGIAWDLAMREQFNWKVFEAVGKGVVCYNRRDVLDWALEEREEVLLKGICYAAAGEERLDILNEVWNNVNNEDDIRRGIFGGLHDYAVRHGKLNVLKWTFGKGLSISNHWYAGLAAEKGHLDILQWLREKIFECVDVYAARCGYLHVLKWVETKGLPLSKERCAGTAAHHGQLNILEWLKEEKDFELDGDLYREAANGGHLHVMIWLREKEVDWNVDTFRYAAWSGNLDVLQWLHDEGCPWPEDIYVCEYTVKRETLDWCRVNGYGNRFIIF